MPFNFLTGLSIAQWIRIISAVIILSICVYVKLHIDNLNHIIEEKDKEIISHIAEIKSLKSSIEIQNISIAQAGQNKLTLEKSLSNTTHQNSQLLEAANTLSIAIASRPPVLTCDDAMSAIKINTATLARGWNR